MLADSYGSTWPPTGLDCGSVRGVDKQLDVRNARYRQMVVDAVASPGDSLKNIYFGLIMGLSAMIPTTIHIAMFFRAVGRAARAKRKSGATQ